MSVNMSKMSKQFPVLVELDTNQKQLWGLFGEANNIEEALSFQKEEGVEKCLYCNVNPFFFMTNNREWYPLIILEAFPVDS